MKVFLGIVLVLLLASCGTKSDPSPSTPNIEPPVVQEEKTLPKDEAPEEDTDNESDEANTREEDEAKQKEIDETVDEVLNDIFNAQADLEERTESAILPESPAEAAPEDISISTTYNNPKGRVDMNIQYVLSPEGIIESISVTSPNYGGMSQFNEKVQKVVGMSVEEASEYHVSGSSLTTPAFQAALKNS